MSKWCSVGNFVRVFARRRFIGGGTRLANREELRVVDGCGIYVPADPKMTDDEIRRCLRGEREETLHIQADSVDEAIKAFAEFEGAVAGALTVNSAKPPIFIPACPRMFKTEDGDLSCGNPDESDCTQGCVLERFDPPENCPVVKFLAGNGA